MSDVKYVMPPVGTTCGYRRSDGAMWLKCSPGPDKKPGIAACDHPGNLVNPACYKLVAVFENEADRDFVIDMHTKYVAPTSGKEKVVASGPGPHERKCWACGNVAIHQDNVTPWVLCENCGSQDTRPTAKREVKSPKDDGDEPITEEWLRSIGFDDSKPCHVHGTPNCNWYSESLDLEIWNHNNSGDWLWVEADSVSMRKRNDLRLLMNWINLKCGVRVSWEDRS